MQKPIFFFLISIILLPAFSYADERFNHFPSDLLYKGKPIDSLCLTSEEKDEDLRKCEIRNRNFKITGHDQSNISRGFIGAEYSLRRDNKLSFFANGYYKVITKINDSYIIYALYSYGGTGSFTQLSLLKREGNHLHLDNLRAGDRAQSGITDVRVVDQALTYHVRITPFNLLSLTKLDSSLYKDLADCMVCDIAGDSSAVYQRKLGKPLSEEKLLYIDLGKELQDSFLKDKQNICFTKVTNEYRQNGKQFITLQDLNTFSNLFYKCVQNDLISKPLDQVATIIK